MHEGNFIAGRKGWGTTSMLWLLGSVLLWRYASLSGCHLNKNVKEDTAKVVRLLRHDQCKGILLNFDGKTNKDCFLPWADGVKSR